jgi:hypothetical protein
MGVQRGQEAMRRGSDLLDRAVKGFGVGLRGLVEPDSLRTNCSAEA